jgi:prefoldin subunit 5
MQTEIDIPQCIIDFAYKRISQINSQLNVIQSLHISCKDDAETLEDLKEMQKQKEKLIWFVKFYSQTLNQ